ncbi:MAG: FprA family A-type flavoprotein [Candidatus Bathyarchaeota archaeon]|nr:FprA family A-type flavoprotein [Candidatus Bathyarchaeota archaeon]
MTNSNKPLPICPDVHWVGANDTETPLFEGLWSIPEGVSYNSYLVRGSEKTALIDSVHEKKAQEHFDKISSLTDLSKIDYLIINHMEPDHTSAIPQLLKKAPNTKLVFTPIAQVIFKKFYGTNPDAVLVKGDDMKLSLGNKTLKFLQTPWLHWPETMTTYLPEDKILFCCDTFGSFKKLPDGAILESDIYMNKQNICECSQKYFASVFNGQRDWVLKAIEKFDALKLEVEVLAPSHGPVYTASVEQTLRQWADWSKGSCKKTVVIAYGSMYGMTAKCLGALEEGVKEAGGTVQAFNLSEVDPVDALTALVEAPALIVGAPTYEHEVFPKVADFVNLLRVKKFSNRCATTFGSFSGSGEATRKLSAELTELGFEVVGKPLPGYGSPTEADLEKVKELGKSLAERTFSKYNAV